MTEDRTIGSALKSTTNSVMRYIERADGPKRFANITGNNHRIIVYLAESKNDEIYQKDFEEAFSIKRSTASRVLQRMEDKGLLVREKADHDARQRKLSLTEKSRGIYEEIVDDVKKIEHAILEGFTDKEKQTLFHLLDRIQKNVQ